VFDDEMLTIEDLAAYLKLKPQTIYKWAQSGKVPGAKFGKEWRFRRSTIEAWIDSHMNAGSPDPPAEGPTAGKTPAPSRRKDRGPPGNGTVDPAGAPHPGDAADSGAARSRVSQSRVSQSRAARGPVAKGREEAGREGDEQEGGGRSRRRGVTRRGARSRGEERRVLEERGPERN
jgi:excisionase family DNA binding protein